LSRPRGTHSMIDLFSIDRPPLCAGIAYRPG
jgi:hypothetical protein